jgi:hypothetical protein
LSQTLPTILLCFLLRNLKVFLGNPWLVQLNILLDGQMISDSPLWHIFDEFSPVIGVNFLRPDRFLGHILTVDDGVAEVVDDHIEVRKSFDYLIGPRFYNFFHPIEQLLVPLGVNPIFLVHVAAGQKFTRF